MSSGYPRSFLLRFLLVSVLWVLTSELLITTLPPAPSTTFSSSSSSPSPLQFDKKTALAHLYYTQLSGCPEATVRNWTCPKWCGFPAVRPTEIHFVENVAQGTRGLVAFVQPLRLLIVSFRGSENIQNWIDNLEFRKTTLHFGSPPAGVYVHTGFQAAYESMRNQTLSAVSTLLSSSASGCHQGVGGGGGGGSCRLLVVGHSLGGAVATLAALDLATASSLPALIARPMQLTTFGSPRVGNAAFAAWAMQVIGYETSTRLVNKYDVVPSLPPMSFGFHHLATEVWEMKNTTTTTTTTAEAEAEREVEEGRPPLPYSHPLPSPSPSPSPPPPPPPVAEDAYVVCDSSGEDPACATYRANSIEDHLHYMQENLGYC